MSKTRKIKFALPKGNLNKRADYRGYTGFLLQLAGFKMEGYKPGKESQMPIAEGERDIEFYCMKPKEMPLLLERGVIDIAIMGRDTLEERYSEELAKLFDELELYIGKKTDHPILGGKFHESFEAVQRRTAYPMDDWINGTSKPILTDRNGRETEIRAISLANLGLGKVGICVGTPDNREYRSGKSSLRDIVIIDEAKIIASAYPNITKRILLEQLGMRIESAEVYPITSSTEVMVKLGIADLVIDSVASGESFSRNNLVKVGESIATSTANLYTNILIAGDYRIHKKDSKHEQSYGDEIDLGINLKRLDEIVQRLKEASYQYGLTRKDSIYYKERAQ